MKLNLDFDLPRSTIAAFVAVAGLAAIGLTTLVPASGGTGQTLLVVPVLTGLLAVMLLLWTRQTMDRVREEVGSGTTTDPETGVATAPAGEQVLEMEFSAAQRGRQLAVALVGVAGLDEYRREHGKAVAKQLVREVGRTLARNRRGMHLTAHYDGVDGAFLSILSGSDRDGAAVYGTRVRRAVRKLKGVPSPKGLTVGIALFDLSMDSKEELLRRAEYALKKGSEAGGKVVVVGESNASKSKAASA